MDRASRQNRDKAEVRLALTAARSSLPEADRAERSRRIADICRGLPGFASAEVVCTYVEFRDEVMTTGLISTLFDEGRRVAVPVHLHGARQSLVFAEISSLSELVPNHFGIPQPPRERARFLPTAAIPLFLVPGLAFDPAGRRLGYGLGFYDRAFAAAAPGALKVGLAFEVQILARVPSDPHDVPMDFVVTEDRVIPAAAGAGTPTRRW